MATVTIHQWPDLDAGLRELRRVSRGPVVILTFDGPAMHEFWLDDYVPEVIAAEARRVPRARPRGGRPRRRRSRVTEVPIPVDCVDGFVEAYYARPEALLDPIVPPLSPAARPSAATGSVWASTATAVVAARAASRRALDARSSPGAALEAWPRHGASPRLRMTQLATA